MQVGTQGLGVLVTVVTIKARARLSARGLWIECLCLILSVIYAVIVPPPPSAMGVILQIRKLRQRSQIFYLRLQS
jgi:hypothetical protein